MSKEQETKNKVIVDTIIKNLEQLKKQRVFQYCDISDIGNVIGIAVGDTTKCNEDAYQKDDFINGVKHGISLKDGTH